MAEQEAAPAAADAPAPAPKAVDAVPYERFQEVNETAKAFKSQLEEMQKAMRERDEAEMSAAEREKSARERAESELNSAKAEAETYKRGRLIAKAARDAGFTDPDFAAEYLANKAGIETDAQAAKAVDQLAKRVPGLVQQEPTPPQLGRVIENGQPVDPTNVGEAAAKKRFEDDLREAVGFPTT